MRRLIQWCLVVMLAIPLLQIHHPVSAKPSPETLYTCLFPDGPFAGQEILVRYDAPDAELSLVSNNTGETVQMLETGLNTPQFEVRGWSSDCRYMIASIGVWGEQQTAAWDVVENRRVGTIETKGQRYTDLIWSPANDNRLLIESLSGAWLWHLLTNSQARLTPFSDETGRNFTVSGRFSHRLEWDLVNHQLLGVPIDADRDGVAAYDLYTGQEVRFFALPPTPRTPRFVTFDGGHHILVFAYDEPVGEASLLFMYNRDDGSALQLAPITLTAFNPLATFSASRRYLIIRTWQVFIWDLQNLDAGPIHQPNHTLAVFAGTHYGGAIDAVRMTANDTIVQAVAQWYMRDFTIWQWDLATGERFYVKKFLKTVCDDLSQLAPEDDVELVTWACGYR
ncbi:MAG: hypothetical protein K8L91_21185 [Anaerolineae bacterium]|nr:hypothetical protein [Anaerolineae bacterium]